MHINILGSHKQRLISLCLGLAVWILIGKLAYANDQYAGFPEPQANFQQHTDKVRRYLQDTQMPQREINDVEFNLPFERLADVSQQYKGKFLLIHGLNDSPYVFSDVATMLTRRGYDVRAILLPGHGNTPRAQLNMSYKKWLKAARQQFSLWDDGATPMYVGGFSMGGVLATILALENDSIEGLLLFSPAYKSTMNHLLRWSGIYSRFKPWVFGGMIIEDNPTKYNSIPINGAAQYYNLTKVLRHAWAKRSKGKRRLSIPVLAVASVDDSVVDINFTIDWFNKRFASENKKLIVYSNDTTLTDTQYVDYRTSSHPEYRILNQSHQSVLMSADNPLFGENGSVLVCNGNDWPTFSGCLYSDESHWYGAQHTPSPDAVPVARTTFNPDFNVVFEEFDKVFQ